MLKKLKYTWRMLKVIYKKDSAHDYIGFYFLIKEKLSAYLEEVESIELVNGKKSKEYRSARLMIKLIDRYILEKSSRPIDRVREKYGGRKFWSYPIDDGEYYKVGIDWNNTMTAKQRILAKEDFKQAVKVSSRIYLRDERLFNDIFSKYHRTWWI